MTKVNPVNTRAPETPVSINTFLVQSSGASEPQIIISLTPPPVGKLGPGRLFALAKISSTHPNFKPEAQIFINKFFKYFQGLFANDPNTAFERSLDWANHHIKEIIDIRSDGQLNMALGYLRNENIQFAVAGSLAAFIIFKEKDGYQELNLISNYARAQENAVEIFSDLISGTLHPNNFVLFGTNAIFDFLTIARLKKIIVAQPPKETCSYLEKLLSQLESQAGFGGLIVSCAPAGAPKAAAGSARLGSNASIRRLVSQERETAQVLSPSIWPDIKKLFAFEATAKKFPAPASSAGEPAAPNASLGGSAAPEQKTRFQNAAVLKKITRVYNSLNSRRVQIKDNLALINRGAAQAVKKIYLTAVRAAVLIINLPAAIRMSPPQKENLKKSVKNIFINTVRAAASLAVVLRPPILRLKFHFMSLPPKRRLIFSIFCSLFLVFLISLAAARLWESRQLANEHYNQTVNALKIKIDEAEADIIYKNETAAYELLEQIRASLASFPRDSKSRRQMFERLSGASVNLADKLRHYVAVAPQTEIDLSALPSGITPTDFIMFKKNFLFLTREAATAYHYSVSDKKLLPLTINGLNDFQNKTLFNDGAVLLLGSGNQIVKFDDSTAAFEIKNIDGLGAGDSINQIAIYNRRLYSINQKNNRLLKHNQTATGFGKGENWLKENEADLNNAIDIAIDGAIYVAKNSGEILKLENGRKQNFNLARLDPPLQAVSAIKIFTQKGSGKFFIMDPAQKRIIVWDKKENRTISQLISPEFDNLRDFTVNEKEKKIYVLNNKKILSVKY